MQTRQLAAFVSALTYADLPADVVEKAKQCVTDLIGVALAGSQEPAGLIWRTYFSSNCPVNHPVTLFAPALPTMAYQQAAALNAAWAHLLDLDDVHNASITHLGAVTIPAALAVGQCQRRSGAEVLAAVAAGYEIGGRIGKTINPNAYYYWHTTGVVGGFAAAAATGKLIGLDAEHMTQAFGSAGTQSAGLWEFLDDGAMSKSLHTANATMCGIRAAELAALGFTGASQILEGERGLIRALADDVDPNMLVKGLGSGFQLSTNSFKTYPCCRHIHSAIEAAELLHPSLAGHWDEIVSIEDRTYHTALTVTDRPTPQSVYAHRFSGQYCVAAALAEGALVEGAFQPESLENRVIRRLMGLVQLSEDPEINRVNREDHDKWPHKLMVTLRSGQCFEQYVEYPPGDYHRPFGWEDVADKFCRSARGVLPEKQALTLLGRIRRMEQLGDINALFTGLGGETLDFSDKDGDKS